MVLTCFFLLALWALASLFAYFWVNLVISLSPLLVVTLSLQPKSRPTEFVPHCTFLNCFRLLAWVSLMAWMVWECKPNSSPLPLV
ncbi:hypothetical protein A7456_10695 [Moraxella nonliquefaciens]|uniref:Uncharacterized protein n=1 Tax=Moraxella nonliquefaciens TaxID=478 RepID=A0A1B8QKV9_MORNO|nr:hypothetical protein A7456_10695 [Moraxella nonliquefaciens]